MRTGAILSLPEQLLCLRDQRHCSSARKQTPPVHGPYVAARHLLLFDATNPSPPPLAASPHDSVGAGGEVGNIGLQSASGHTSAHAPRGVPAESRSDRAEHAAEQDFMELVGGALTPSRAL